MRFKAVFLRFQVVLAVFVQLVVFTAKMPHTQDFGVKRGLFYIVRFVSTFVVSWVQYTQKNPPSDRIGDFRGFEFG